MRTRVVMVVAVMVVMSPDGIKMGVGVVVVVIHNIRNKLIGLVSMMLLVMVVMIMAEFVIIIDNHFILHFKKFAQLHWICGVK